MPRLLCFLLLLLLCHTASAQVDSLRNRIRNIISPVKADFGIAIKMMDGNDTLSIQGSAHYPMQSAFKFPLAMAMLKQVDAGKFALDQKIGLSKSDYFPTHSPLAKKYPEGNAEVTLREIIYETVYMSDNVGCDVMFRLLGGTKEVEKYVHGLGVKDMAILYNEREMHSDWNIPFKNYSTPRAMVQLLEIFSEEKKLSSTSQDFLWKAMVESPTGPNRIRAGLPKGTVFAHKTGTGGRNEQGVLGAINDAGIIVLPDGRKLAMVIFVTNSLEPDSRIETVVGAVARAVFEFYSGSGKP
ncbi:MAG TPA: class A beta-lactamase [Ohtaekwangia sp.]